MESFERQHSKIENEELINKFIDAYADELEEMVTEPRAPFSKEELGVVSKFREERKLPRSNKWFHDLFVRVAQDFRFNPDEIDILRDRFLE